MIALRTEEGEEKSAGRRYLSKNNLNIARLAALPEPLQEGTILVPFRDPVQQAVSVHRQHERLLEIHEEDDFVREYMEAIGHHEFGKGLKPVNFGGGQKLCRSGRFRVLAPVLVCGISIYSEPRRGTSGSDFLYPAH